MKSGTRMTIFMLLGVLSLCANPLGDLANAMQPGTWAELSQTNINDVLGQGGHSGNRIGYSNAGAWDPVDQVLHLTGEDHGEGGERYMTYSAKSNAWTEVGIVEDGGHGFDHITIDPSARVLYYTPYYSTTMKRLDLAGSGTWTTLPAMPTAWRDITWGTAFFPGLGFVVYNSYKPGGEIWIYNPSLNQWMPVIEGFGGAQTYHQVAEFSPVHHVAVFGGGNANPNKLWRLNADRTVTAMPDAPIIIGILRANLTVDPVTGNFLVLGLGQLWELDPRGAGKWTQQTGSRTPPGTVRDPVGDPSGCISAPVSNYGVVTYVSCRMSVCKMHLYKHADPTSTGREDAVTSREAAESGGIQVSPNPVRGVAKIHLAHPSASVSILDVNGKVVEYILRSGEEELSWNPGHLARGIYLVQSLSGGRRYSTKVLVQ